ncbi:plasmid partitioning/stability family protein [Lelliottia nimipressuralis]|uniref:Mediator of plasmid stability n=1 Tax=Lelliottia nimipressuralis TaxID=69220 RepID=A0ABD4KI22_9ENTR|nr:plasmid partitioning/stability family protein [Lelliottia nimipressuralis]MBF4180660.1 Mediator of plasmid stability [Lelliottia nimipressuralis]
MPDGQYSFYLHSDDRTDIAAMATISTISQPLRGDFIRTVTTAGAVVYLTDTRLPALIPVFFDGQLSAGRLYGLMALVSGRWSSLSVLPDEPDAGMKALMVTPETESRRRRYTLALQDDRSSERVESLLSGVSSRQRGELLRNLIITGLALHTIAPELPRLLASMPVPPATVSELQALILQMAGSGITESGTAAVLAPEQQVSSVTPVSGTQTAGIKKNMRRAFGD